jgi:alpha/beta superfamily hydrolase
MSRSFGSVVFSHGKESGPWGAKITAMADVVRDLGLAAVSVDYRGIEDPAQRVAKLVDSCRELQEAVVLVGSSLGGHVCAAAARQVQPRGVFLLAPAFYMPGYEDYTPRDVPCPSVIVHGWNDAIVPVENGIRWAREHRSTLHVLDSDHRLEDQIEEISRLLRAFLRSLGA